MYRGKELPKLNALGLPVNWYGLADGNSFYCSCEASMQPWIADRPIIVASNSDKIAIALNRPAKALGFKMGDLLFEKVAEIKRHGVLVFSSNYELYGDISGNMHAALGSFVDQIEVSSIDEAFLKFTGMDSCDIEEYGRRIVRTIRKGLWLPVSLGIAQTKTLAKVANKLSKKDEGSRGLRVIVTEEERIEALGSLPLYDVWGVGRRWYEKLRGQLGMESPTALDFASMYRKRVRKLLGVVGERTWMELNGIECVPFELVPDDKDSIKTSRMFAEGAETFEEVMAAVVRFLSSAARKLRRQNSYAQSVYVYFLTSVNENYKGPKDARGLEVPFTSPLNTTAQIMPYVKAIMEKLWPRYAPGQVRFRYVKAGVQLNGIIPAEARQLQLDEDPCRQAKMERLQKAVDEINGLLNMDNRLIVYGSERTASRKVVMTRKMKSGNPTILWSDRIKISNS